MHLEGHGYLGYMVMNLLTACDNGPLPWARSLAAESNWSEIVSLMEGRAMRKGVVLWTVFLVLGGLIWLESVGVGRHPSYRLGLMVVALSWFGYTARLQSSRPTSNRS